ncbi:uncharacterized protein LOC133901972 [Phragmites australis]|uniref:uncharacterized protein LOC133901972 n=1 Tax=Phragmites australis TaxID=29695 RepID=UPI002D79E4F8|nr:uncharacterized protein LOC133901972 [Phragmites australis]
MELLDMVPALRLYSLPAAAAAACSLCAWLVAALAAAAAVGLWRIRAVGVSKPDAGVRGGSALVKDKQAHAAPPSSAAIEEPRPAAQAETASASEPSTPSKVRFAAYYGGSGNDGVVDGVRKWADAEDDDCARVVVGEVDMVLRRTASAPGRRMATALAAAPWEDREMAVKRRGDLGWYRHLDMGALDGSVVRLWDGELTASPRGRRRRAGLELQLSL